MEESNIYLGDGLYASFDGQMIKVFASDGLGATNVIYLEPEVALALVEFVRSVFPQLFK